MPEKTRGRSCVSSLCLPPSAAARSPTSTTVCRRSACGSSWRCILWPGNSTSRARRRVCSSPWNEARKPSRCSHRFKPSSHGCERSWDGCRYWLRPIEKDATLFPVVSVRLHEWKCVWCLHSPSIVPSSSTLLEQRWLDGGRMRESLAHRCRLTHSSVVSQE